MLALICLRLRRAPCCCSSCAVGHKGVVSTPLFPRGLALALSVPARALGLFLIFWRWDTFEPVTIAIRATEAREVVRPLGLPPFG